MSVVNALLTVLFALKREKAAAEKKCFPEYHGLLFQQNALFKLLKPRMLINGYVVSAFKP